MALNTIAAIVLTLFVTFNDVLAVTPSPGCGINQASGTVSHKTTVNGKQRLYITNVPTNYNSSSPHRLIFMFHGLGNSAAAVANGQQGFLPFMGLPPLANADSIGAISVAPDGLNSGWANSGGEDIAFVDQMIREIEASLCIDQNLRFSTGFSYGASMTYAIACARAKQFRGVAVVSGALLSGCTGKTDPIAYYGQHGTSDGTIPIASGKQLRDTFVALNGCTKQTTMDAAPGSGTLVKTQYQNCNKNFPVTWISFDGGHTSTPTTKGASKSFTPEESWAFFKQFT
ncbi:alpha/beta-Hydrolase [Glarea lozoyensis ATCC 20868]|uniref:Feruloyl esterase C n=1 Tax=Glarea lozoyensis (strain ATCC 20868 / MF5171) TaxID=1116229 RepID=S3DDW6_GLAL2|nr:alpha/beta-Hydrolase [Glarea lozoyensis ATCC 20868]EPE24823.1 alpha/beta-Hydrolase [Glarea lozoyensis ATCC 20868]